MTAKHKVIRSRRRTLALEITPQGEVLVRAPLHASQEAIRSFVEGKERWIETHLAQVRERMTAAARQLKNGYIVDLGPLVALELLVGPTGLITTMNAPSVEGVRVK